MKLALFMKYYSLVLMFASAGAAISYVVRKEWLPAIFCVMSCAINHFCYNVWSKSLK